MQNNLPSPHRQKTNTTKLSTTPLGEILKILMMSNISRPNNFQVLDASEWKWICSEVQKDFGDKLTKSELEEIISNGIKGGYDRTQFVINGFTIYKWIKIFLSKKPKQVLSCPKDYDPFYWNQLSEREQIEWIEKTKKSEEK